MSRATIGRKPRARLGIVAIRRPSVGAVEEGCGDGRQGPSDCAGGVRDENVWAAGTSTIHTSPGGAPRRQRPRAINVVAEYN